MSQLTTSELTNLIHMRTRRMMPLVTDVVPRNNTVLYTVGSRRYLANRRLEVLEVAADKVFDSPHAKYQQGLLRGGKRDEDGTLICEIALQGIGYCCLHPIQGNLLPNEVVTKDYLRGDSGSTIIKDE